MEPLRISNLQSFSRTYVVMSRRMLVLNCTVTVLVKQKELRLFLVEWLNLDSTKHSSAREPLTK